MQIIAGLIGVVLIALTLWDVFVVMVLTRRASRRLQLTTFLTYIFRWVYRAVARRVDDRTSRERYLSMSGPILLFARFGVWAVVVIFGFALLQWAAGSRIAAPDGSASFGTILYFSATTFFTVALGNVTPEALLPRILNILEAATGFLFLGLVISYLPVFYTDYSDREARLTMLDEWAGTPPSAGELLRRLGHDRALAALDPFLQDWEVWSAEVLESHLSYPILALFRSQHENQSWVAALAAILDVSALVLVGIDGVNPRAARLTFAMARHTAVDLGQALGNPRQKVVLDRLPPGELARLRSMLKSHGVNLSDGATADAKLLELRGLYEPYINALSKALFMELPAWLPDEDAVDNWQKTAFFSTLPHDQRNE